MDNKLFYTELHAADHKTYVVREYLKNCYCNLRGMV